MVGTGHQNCTSPDCRHDVHNMSARIYSQFPGILQSAWQNLGCHTAACVTPQNAQCQTVLTRSTCCLSQAAREFVGRLMADPGFVHKLVGETVLAASSSLYYEWWLRRERFGKELDLALINTIGVAAATAATVWMVSPSRSYGTVHKFPWQKMLDGLPNMVFDSSGPMRHYTHTSRVGGFVAKMAELSAVGAIAGGATAALSRGAVALHKRVDPTFEPSVPVPELGRSSAGMGAYFALNANTRYQLIGGMDKYLFERANMIWAYVAMTGVYRVVSNRVGEASRPWWQGLPTEPTKRKVRRNRTRSSGPHVRRAEYDSFMRNARGEGGAVQFA
jgi:hypothetical protein